MKRICISWGCALGIVFLISSCNNSAEQSAQTGTEVTEQIALQEEGTVAEDGKIHLTIETNDAMKFNKKELKAKEGIPIRLVLTHTGKMSKQEMGHNIVFLKAGVDGRNFALKAMDARETEYIPSTEKDNIIAYSRLIGGGEFAVVEFIAPPKGSYEFLCSFPGHYNLMKGVLIVE